MPTLETVELFSPSNDMRVQEEKEGEIFLGITKLPKLRRLKITAYTAEILTLFRDCSTIKEFSLVNGKINAETLQEDMGELGRSLTSLTMRNVKLIGKIVKPAVSF